MTALNLRIDASTEDYLKKINRESGDKSLSLTAKNLIKWCQNNGVDPTESYQGFDADLRKMIEHIHLSIPHMMLSLSTVAQATFGESDEDDKKEMIKKTLKKLNQKCGDFQNINYKNVKVSFNKFGLKQAPESEELSEWK